MTESQLRNFTNPRPTYNTPLFAALYLGARLERWSWQNLRNFTRPPKVLNIQLLPLDKSQKGDEAFELAMFQEGGFLHETPLNHYINLSPASAPDEVYMVNAGYLLNHFIISDSLGFAELRRLMTNAKAQAKTSGEPESNSEFQTPSTAQQE